MIFHMPECPVSHIPVDIGHPGGDARNEGVPGDRRLLPEPGYGGDNPGIKVAGSDLYPERHSPQFPVVIFRTGSEIPAIHFHPVPGCLKLFLQLFGCRCNLLLPFLHDHRDNDDLGRCNFCRERKPAIITVQADEGGNGSL